MSLLSEAEARSIAQEVAANLPDGNALEWYAQEGEVYSDAIDEVDEAIDEAIAGLWPSTTVERLDDLRDHLLQRYETQEN